MSNNLFFALVKRNISVLLKNKKQTLIYFILAVVNTFMYVYIWYLVFRKFPVLHGWTINDMSLLLGVLLTSFGITAFLFADSMRNGAEIFEQDFEVFLTQPGSMLTRCMMRRSSIFDLADVFNGSVLFWYAIKDNFSYTKLLLFIAIVFLTVVALFSYLTIILSISIMKKSLRSGREQLFWAFFMFGSYPQNILEKSFFKIITLTIFPTFFIYAMPVNLLKNFEIAYALYYLSFVLIFFIFARWFFYFSLKRYK